MADRINWNHTNSEGMGIPVSVSKTIVYVGATNNISTITHKNSEGTTLGVLTMTYVDTAGATITPAVDDALLGTITRTT